DGPARSSAIQLEQGVAVVAALIHAPAAVVLEPPSNLAGMGGKKAGDHEASAAPAALVQLFGELAEDRQLEVADHQVEALVEPIERAALEATGVVEVVQASVVTCGVDGDGVDIDPERRAGAARHRHDRQHPGATPDVQNGAARMA